jgi:hypothetical protein
MTQLRADLVNRVLLDMDVIGVGQIAPDDVYSDIDNRLDTIVAELNARDIVNIDLDNIDDALFEPLVEFIIAKAGPGYGRGALDPVTLSLIEDRMKEVTRAAAPRKTLRTDSVLRQGVRPILRSYWNC